MIEPLSSKELNSLIITSDIAENNIQIYLQRWKHFDFFCYSDNDNLK